MKQVFWLLVLALTAGADCPETRETRTGRLSVEAYALTGDRLPNPEIEITGPDTRRVKFSSGQRLRYGWYQLSVAHRDFYTSRREILVDRPELTARMELTFGGECDNGLRMISGKVNETVLNDVWVKGIRLRGTETVETRVNPQSGRYVLTVPAGDHVILVMRGREVLHQRVVSVLHGEPVDF